jgi:DNA-binding transcriptional MocR family regulator
VAFVPGAPFFAVEADHRTLRLSFTTHTPAQIAEGLGRLGAAVHS